MSPLAIAGCIVFYFALLITVASLAGRGATMSGYFIGNRNSPWWLIAFGVIGDSLSGVTFISVPGEVGVKAFGYLQVVLGYVLGYIVIAEVLLPLFYRQKLTSIYAYLGHRFGVEAQRTGALSFLVSRILGSAARLYLALSVFQKFVFSAWGIPFGLTALVVIALMLIYTMRGGIQSLVWTDLMQSGFLVAGLICSLVVLAARIPVSSTEIFALLRDSSKATVFNWDWQSPGYFWKQFLSGAFIAVVMTGLDQNSMQKNLSCRSLNDARKNIYAFIPVLVLVNILFLTLGLLLSEYVSRHGISPPVRSDFLFPSVALQHLGGLAAWVFVIGLTAATFNSADSVLTSLTTSFCFDFLGWDQHGNSESMDRERTRRRIHVAFAFLLLIVLLVFGEVANDSVISMVLKLAGFTYGPLLGLFALGLLSKVEISGWGISIVCGAAPVVCFILDRKSKQWLGGYQFGFELLILNGLITAVGLVLLSTSARRFRKG